MNTILMSTTFEICCPNRGRSSILNKDCWRRTWQTNSNLYDLRAASFSSARPNLWSNHSRVQLGQLESIPPQINVAKIHRILGSLQIGNEHIGRERDLERRTSTCRLYNLFRDRFAAGLLPFLAFYHAGNWTLRIAFILSMNLSPVESIQKLVLTCHHLDDRSTSSVQAIWGSQ